MVIVGGIVALAAFDPGQVAAVQAPSTQELAGLSLEQLAEIEITSVSRRPEPLSGAAAAVYVITREDIRRSGAASLPEVLRLAPNLQVQRVNSGDYAISARGFNSFETANKLLVLIDGRSIYTTLFSGVLWDAQGLVLEDIERIEVISGPGGALYGSNAVNGVINITTRSAGDTQGPALSVGAGDDDRVVSARHGGRLGEAGAWRLAVTGFDRSDTRLESGISAADQTAGLRLSGRADWSGAGGDWTVLGDLYDHQVTGDAVLQGGFVQAGWRRAFGDAGALSIQTYYDETNRAAAGVEEVVKTWDVAVQHAWDRGGHRFVIGAGYRSVDNRLTSPPTSPAFLAPERRRITLASVFAQDQISLGPDLVLTLGIKLEDSSFTGAEFLPNARLAWTRPDGSLVWGAVSRAARTANRIDRDLTLPGFLVGGDFQSEMVTAWELGYRAQPTPDLLLSISAFYNDYTDLRTVAPDAATFLPLSFANDAAGHTSGVEAWATYQATPRWRFDLGVATLDKTFALTPGAIDISSLASTGDDPAYQVLVGARGQLTDAIEFDLRLRAVDDLDRSGIDGYVDADARLGWRLGDGLEVALSGSNLFDDQKLEAGDPARRRLIGRSVFLSLKAGF